MRIILTTFFLFTAFLFQLAFREVGFNLGFANLVLTYLCFLLATNITEEVLWLALGFGILIDVMSGLPDGVMAISLPAGIKFAKYIGDSFFTERLRAFILPAYNVAASFGTLIAALLVLGIMSLVGWVYPPNSWYYFTWLLPLTVVLNLLSMIPAYTLHNLEQWLQKRYIPKHESF